LADTGQPGMLGIRGWKRKSFKQKGEENVT
jgi:hypothetical protein